MSALPRFGARPGRRALPRPPGRVGAREPVGARERIVARERAGAWERAGFRERVGAWGAGFRERVGVWCRRWVRPAPTARRRLGQALAGGLVAAGAGALLAGPVAALLVGGYTAVALRALLGRAVGRAEARRREGALDAVVGLAADLRAGLPMARAAETAGGRLALPGSGSGTRLALPGSGARALPVSGWGADRSPASGSGTADGRVLAACRLAERTGAPLADILDLVVLDLREEHSRQAQTAAQLAGARATMGILTALPAMGLALGYTIGGDPLAVLLHTPFGAVCAVLALLLQLLGLAWADRLVRRASA
ncbi:hypothetical protein R8Z50_34675 [Longispora sp. K20-0274]|uniref:type II secretion system F family protein n=1 Tax=Longispora sp. K20-0274 TaxID=3088255 RepID=UPI0039996AB5